MFFASLFTIKDGLVFVEANPVSGGDFATQAGDPEVHDFADVNGDDWFYFQDESTWSDSSSREQCAKPMAQSQFSARTISGSDTTLINFAYDRTPSHRVLHEGRCNFAGLAPVSPSSQSDPDSGRSRFRSQEM